MSKLTTVDNYHLELALKELELFDRAEAMADDALEALDDQVRLMGLRFDYHWLKLQINNLFPLGIRSDVDEKLVRLYANQAECSHIVDALIDELSLKGAGIELALPDRLRA